MTETTRLIRASVNLLDAFGTKTDDGRTLTASWGESVGSCGVEPGLSEAERVAQARADALREAAERVRGLPMVGSRPISSRAAVYRAAVLAILTETEATR